MIVNELTLIDYVNRNAGELKRQFLQESLM